MTNSWQRLLELKEASATPGHPAQEESRQDYRNMLIAENAEYAADLAEQRRPVAATS